jgi:hypothetical protein
MTAREQLQDARLAFCVADAAVVNLKTPAANQYRRECYRRWIEAVIRFGWGQHETW